MFCYLREKMGFPLLFRGPLWLSPTPRGVERRANCLLAISVVACIVEELTSRTRHAAPESGDEGRARHSILERRDGVVVSHTGELGAVPGEAPKLLT
jgi:hypothetical protein